MDKIVLGEEQLQALDLMKEFISSNVTAFSLIGSAGTGKTLLINELLKWIKANNIGYVLCAPTNKAGLVLREVTKDENVTTIHKLLTLTPNLEIFELDFNELEFQIKNPLNLGIPHNGVVICDEASMINDELFKTIIHHASLYNSKVIFVGDFCQLQPVNANKVSKVFNLDNKFELTKIYRQSSENAILPVLQELREKPISSFSQRLAEEGSLYCFTDTKEFLKPAYKVYKEAIKEGNILKTKILAYTNRRVEAYNKCMKKLLFSNENEYNKGEFLTAYENLDSSMTICNSMDYIIASDPVKIDIRIHKFGVSLPGYSLELYDSFFDRSGNIRILSREIDESYFLQIADFIEDIRLDAIDLKKRGWFKKSKMRWVDYFNAMDSFTTPVDLYLGNRLVRSKSFDYGYAISTHKSQGSSIDTVFVDIKNINTCRNLDERRQLQYVALSRTKSDVYVLQ